MKRRDPLVVGEYYHIYNRGVEKRIIFDNESDYRRFIESIVIFNTDKSSWEINLINESLSQGPSSTGGRSLRNMGNGFIPERDEMLVDVISYCLNSNHFHLLLKERKENGIATFMKKVCTGYAMYFNKKNERSGVLFQGRFKSVRIDSNDHLLHASVYVNCNSQVHGIESASQYPWCSFSEYSRTVLPGRTVLGAPGVLKERTVLGIPNGICQKEIILEQFRNPEEYKEFCLEKIVGIKDKKELQQYFLEN